MLNRSTAMMLGALTGVLTLVAMLRLISGGFSGDISRFAWGFALLALVPWVLYVAWRARRSRLSRRSAVVVLALNVVGFLLVWVLVVGPVLALACALAAFLVIWIADLPGREPRGEDRFVRIQDLQTEDPE